MLMTTRQIQRLDVSDFVKHCIPGSTQDMAMADRLTNDGDPFCLALLDMAIEDYLFLGGVCCGAKA
jgi:hypothetical protein